MSLQNGTVRLRAEFKDFDNLPVTPENVVLKVYDGRKVQIGSDIPVSPIGEGIFEYDYVLEEPTYGAIYYEFIGTVDGKPILGREKLCVHWTE